MRAGIEITVTPEDRCCLEAIARDRNAKLKHVARAKVILAPADGCGTMPTTVFVATMALDVVGVRCPLLAAGGLVGRP